MVVGGLLVLFVLSLAGPMMSSWLASRSAARVERQRHERWKRFE